MSYQTKQKLNPVEALMPIAKYYNNYPMHDLPQDVKDVIFGHPMDWHDAVPAERFLDWCADFGERNSVHFTISVTDDPALASYGIKKYC